MILTRRSVPKTPSVLLTRCHALEFPYVPKALYRAHLHVENHADIHTKGTYARRVPDWLFYQMIPSDASCHLTLYQLTGDAWESLGTCAFSPGQKEPLDFSGVVLTFHFQEVTQGLPSDIQLQGISWPHALERMDELSPIPGLCEGLNRQDAVFLRDLWQKWLAEKDLCQRLCTNRWLDQSSLCQIPGLDSETLSNNIHRLFENALMAVCPSGPGPDYLASLQSFSDAYLSHSQLETLGDAFIWTLKHLPNLEDFDRQLLSHENNAAARFYHNHILIPVLEQQAVARRIRSMITRDMTPRWYRARSHNAGRTFLKTLESSNQAQILEHFQTNDLNLLEHLLFGILDFSFELAADWQGLEKERQRLADLHARMGIPAETIMHLGEPFKQCIEKQFPELGENQKSDLKSHFDMVLRQIASRSKNRQKIQKEANDFQKVLEEELPEHSLQESQLRTLQQQGLYTHSFEQLEYGAKLAWRNAARCIGRLYWSSLKVFDCRHLTHPKAIFEALLQHLASATHDGKLQSTISIFRPKRPHETFGPRIWNAQLIRYAGYEQEGGRILGDPASLALTKAIEGLGWKRPEKPTAFDVLPVVIDVPGHEPTYFEIPKELMLEVSLKHPKHQAIESLNLRWYAVPAISNFTLEIGGIQYPCAPFNGWYMGTEIARNLGDRNRYNLLPQIAEALDLDTRADRSLWRDEAQLVLNQAIIHSYGEAGVTLVNHHAASRQYMVHDQREKKAGRDVPADWAWIQPPMGGSSCPVYHHVTHNIEAKPAYYQTPDPWLVRGDN